MSESAMPADRADAREWAAHVSALRAQVRRDRRATSLPLLLSGAAIVGGVTPQLVNSGILGSGDWIVGLLLTAAFAIVWLVFRRRAIAGGVGRPAGFGAATLLGLICVSIGVIALVFAGPFLLFGLGLLVAGIWQRNRFLTVWAVLIGGIGVFEGFFGITNRLPAAVWREWDHPAIYLVLGLATMLAGGIAWLRENRGQ